MKILRHYKIETPNGKYDVGWERFSFLINELEDRNIGYFYQRMVDYTIDVDTKEDVCIRNIKITLEKGVVTKLMGLL